MGNADCLAFSVDGSLLAVGSHLSGTVEIWDSQSATFLYSITGSKFGIQALEFSEDGNWLVSCPYDPNFEVGKEFTIWDIHEKRVTKVVTFEKRFGDNKITVPLGGLQLAIYCMNSNLPFNPNCQRCHKNFGLKFKASSGDTSESHGWWTWTLRKPRDTRGFGPLGTRETITVYPGNKLVDDPDTRRVVDGGDAGEGRHLLFFDTVENYHSSTLCVGRWESSTGPPLPPTWNHKLMTIPKHHSAGTPKLAWTRNRCAIACGMDYLLVFDTSKLGNRFGVELDPIHRADYCDHRFVNFAFTVFWYDWFDHSLFS